MDDVLDRHDVDAVVIATPSPDHCAQTIQALNAGRHVLCEVPLVTSRDQLDAVAAAQREARSVLMPAHVRRWNAPQVWLHNRIADERLALQHLVVETFFMRRENVGLDGRPRTWVDHLLWHHAAHSVDLFHHLTGARTVTAHALQGPVDPQFGIPLDLSVQLQAPGGALATIALSFNNDGPQGSWTRVICDRGTFLSRYDELTTAQGDNVDLRGLLPGMSAQADAFIDAVLGRVPKPSLADVMPAYNTLASLDDQLSSS